MKQSTWKILKWITKWLTPHKSYASSLDYWENTINRWLSTQGNLNTMKRIKAIRLHSTRYMCGKPLLKSAHPGVGINAKGLPKALGPLQDLIHGDEWDKRFLLTLLSLSRCIECSGAVSTQDITDVGVAIPPTVIDEHLKTLEILGWNIDRPEWSEYHFSLKAGPNGQAMMGSIHDAHHLTSEHLKDLKILGNSDDLLEKISSIKSNFSSEAWSDKYFWKDRGLRRKLSLVSDPEAKERVIAIFDYWSQTVLKPLHDSLMGFISRIPGDCTYNQQGSSESLPSSGPYYSMDLHAATDRYPVKLQVAVLERLVGSKEYADAWERIMVGEPFSNPWGDPVYYGRGQPMGAYSSWAMFALCHHLTTRTAARLAGHNPAKWNNYALLGDDIVLTDPKVAEIYQQLMDQLGVSLSPSKTHVSDDTYEFAKRWYQAGIEISGMQLHGLSNCTRWHEAAEELISSLSRWSLSPLDMEPGSIPSFLRALGLRVRDSHKVRAFLHLPRKADTEEMQARKSEWLASCHFSDVFGCFDRRDLRRTFVLQTLAEVKTSLMEEGIQNIFTLGQKFLSDLVKDYSGELPDQRVLLDLPVVGSVRSQAIKLQETYDRLRSAYYDNDEDIVFNNIALAMSDPTRIMTKRSSKVVVISRASLVNKYKLWAKNYISTRHHLLSDEGALPD